MHPFIEAHEVFECVKTGYWQCPSVPDTSCVSFKLPNTGSNHSVNFLFYTLKKKWLWVSLTWEIRHWSFCWLSRLEGSQSNNGYLRIFKDLISEMSSLQGSIPFALPSCLFLEMAVNVKPPDRGVHPQKAKLQNWISRAGAVLLDETACCLDPRAWPSEPLQSRAACAHRPCCKTRRCTLWKTARAGGTSGTRKIYLSLQF